MIKETDRKALAVYSYLLFKNGWNLFLRFDPSDDNLYITVMDGWTRAENVNHFYNLKELEDWMLKTKIAKKSDI